ncbi:GDP-L-fucose synthase [Candidatus Termititenax persephonae]|uniref:GDP-L-fucose synthase n=1 Tax=Candidatus Termititenax persephonae TaxID=2218525 RepID=A0A388TGV8_9BACT|nr:GDP-L-fucose synthase [Candidatus Termititenax persephonae]
MEKQNKIFVAGARGMVGSAIVRRLQKAGQTCILTPGHQELDLLDQKATADFFAQEKPEYVIDAAAKVGGIKANDVYSADFIYENLTMQNNIIHNSWQSGVKKLLFLGSSCIYPRDCAQPIKEEYLLTGPLEKTNEGYALAKIAGIMLCRLYRKQYGCDFISAMPTNLYGANDNYHPENSHVIPGLLRRFHEAKIRNAPQVVCWGTGKPLREFLHVDDLADACYHLLQNYSGAEHINIGCGQDLTIKALAELIAKVVGYPGELVWDKTKPDGTPRKLLDISKLKNLGWTYKIDLEAGLTQVYQDFLQKQNP